MDDLISKKEVENKILNFGGFNCWDDKSSLMCEISSAPPAFEGMTNGEVMKAVFPNCYMGIDDDEWIVTNIDGRTMFQPEWWNAPYKAESEVTE